MNLKPLLAAVIGGAAMWKWAGHHNARRVQRLRAKPAAKPREVTTWEGEGGALPTSGAQIGPSPQMP